MAKHPFRPAQGWVFVEMSELDTYRAGTITDVGIDIDPCMVGSDVIAGYKKPIELPLGGVAVKISEIMIVRIDETNFS